MKLLQTVFDDGTQVNASDVHIEPQETNVQIRFRIDGVLLPQTESDVKIGPRWSCASSSWRVWTFPRSVCRRTGALAIIVRTLPVDVRMSTMPTQHGESVVLRLLNQKSGLLGLDHVGMPADMLARFRQIIQRSNAMVLVTGPTGSGKTTTLYAALAELNTVDKKIITVEDPVEYRLPGINQVQINEKIELTFARVLRSALRQDPDIILVGEMRDEETAQIGLRAALTGHLVLSTLHTNDAISSPIRLIDMGAPHYMVATSLHAVVAQRLVRLVCESCAELHPPEANELHWIAAQMGDGAEQARFMRGRGCSNCNGTGFQGRLGVYEMLEMTLELVRATNRNDTNLFTELAKRQMEGHTLARNAFKLAAEGRTTLSEAIRVASTQEE